MKYLYFPFAVCCFLLSSASLGATTVDTLILELISETPISPGNTLAVVPDQLDRPYLYVAAKEGGVYVVDAADPLQPQVIQNLPIDSLGQLEVMNAMQEGQLLYLSLGNFFGAGQQEPGLAILDLSDPENVFVRGFWKGDSVIKGSTFVLVDGDYAYLGAMTAGIQVFNVSDPNAPEWISAFVPPVDFPDPNPSTNNNHNVRSMAVQGDNLWVCYDAGGLRQIDKSDPYNLQELNRYINPVPQPKPQAYNNILLNGNLAYIAVDYCGFEILDISDPANIQEVAWWNPWACDGPDNIWFNSPGHTNQLAYNAEHQLVFLSAGASELLVLDVSNPSQPERCQSWGMPDNLRAAWGIAADPNYLYGAYINSPGIPFWGFWSGVLMVNWTDLTATTAEPTAPTKGFVGRRNPFQDFLSFDLVLPEADRGALRLYDQQGQLKWQTMLEL
ncbi:MAG: hypothetical protein KDC44_18610, partial [Phaeodactylibacter sp.]|nr:hypothetical protein [Phaeodactylibacter sp.]